MVGVRCSVLVFEEIFGSVADDFDVGKAEQRKIVAGEVAKMLIALDIDESALTSVVGFTRKLGNRLRHRYKIDAETAS